MAERLLLMYKDTVVLEFDLSKGIVNKQEQAKYPIPFEMQTGLSFEEDFDTRVNNRSVLEHWFANRVLTLDRTNAKAICNSLGMAQVTTDKDRAAIALTYHALSLSDCYWVKTANEIVYWKDINLFSNHLSNAFIDIALQGKCMTIQNKSIGIPDAATAGVAPKAWARQNDQLWLYKAEKQNNSVLREIEASRILKEMGFPVVEYRLKKYDDKECAASLCFTGEDVNFVAAEDIDCYFELGNVTEFDNTFYEKLILADYLVGNTDRHSSNWGLLHDGKSLIGAAPIFDFDHAFEDNGNMQCLPALFKNESISQLEAVSRLPQLPEGISLNINFDNYTYGWYVKERVNKLRKLLDAKNTEKRERSKSGMDELTKFS